MGKHAKSQNSKKKSGLESDQDIKYWLLTNSRRDHAWIVELQIAEILANSRFLDVNGQIVTDVNLDLRYTYSAVVTSDYLLAIVEDFSGRYYLIRNRKLETEQDSESESESEYESEESETLETPDSPKSPEEIDLVAQATQVAQVLEKPKKKKKVIDEHTLSKLEKESIKFQVFKEKETREVQQLPIDELIESLVTVSTSLNTLIRSMTQTEKTQLAIVKPQRMKLSREDRTTWDERLPLVLTLKPATPTTTATEATTEAPKATATATEATTEASTAPIWVPPTEVWLAWIKQQKESLDLVGMFWITDLTFKGLKLPQIHSLTINQNFRLSNFEWLATSFPNLRQLDLVNQASLTLEGVNRICQACPKLHEFSLHYCPQVNIRILLDILKLPQVQKVCLNQIDLICQTNPYSGLVGPNEWLEIECPSLEKLLINSTNLTLDVIDYLMPVCPNLKRLVIHPTIAEKLRTNVIEMGDELGLEKTTELIVAGLNNKQFTIKRPFKIKGKLKDNFDEPFSESMQKKIKTVYETQDLEDLEDLEGFEDEDPVLLAEVIAEMRANGELSESED